LVESIIRKARIDDCPALRRVHLAASKGPDSLERDNPNVLKWLESRTDDDYLQEMQRESFVVAEINAGIVGYGAIDLKKQNIESVYVDPRYTRRGIATQLVTGMEELARDAGFTKVSLQAAGGALTFYRKIGYQYVSEPAQDGPLWAEMYKEL